MWAFVTNWLTPTSLFLFLNFVIGTIFITSRFTNKRPPQHHQQQNHYNYYHENQQHQLARAPSSLVDRFRPINFSLYKFPTETEPHNADYPQEPQPDYPSRIERAPSFLERFRSMNFPMYKFSTEMTPDSTQYPEPEYPAPVDSTRIERKPSLLERVKSINFSSFYRAEPEAETEAVDGSDLVSGTDSEHGSKQLHHEVRRRELESESEKIRVGKEVKVGKMKKSASEREVEAAEKEVERRRPLTTRVEKAASFGEHDDDQEVDAKADDFINKFKQQLKLQRLDSLLRYREMLKGKQKI